MDYKDLIKELLSDPQKLKQKKPFTRGESQTISSTSYSTSSIGLNETLEAYVPNFEKEIVPQEQFMRELDPNCHDVLFDDNIPSICLKTKNGGYQEIKFSKMAVPFQRNIKNKQVLHLTGRDLQFTLLDRNPTKTISDNFILFKEYWQERNQEGMKTKMVDAQLSYGDAGLLYYFDYKGRIKSRLLSYKDGYVLCPHNDDNGDRILESVYYVKDKVEYIDSYDETYMYRYKKDNSLEHNIENNGWIQETPVKHGFNEIPLITKRGDVAWNDVQNIITSYEVLYNVFNAIQRRHGWGLLYVKGKFKDKSEKIAGSVILNDTSLDGKGDAKFLTPPNPQGTIDTLNLMLETIQLGSSTTFLLPKDIKASGDISGIAIQLTQSLDLENALQKSIEWQNVCNKMVRLFKYGLSKELVTYGINKTAVTDFEQLKIGAKFKVWRPMNEYEYNQMLQVLCNSGILSKETGIEKNTESTPDEKVRIKRENEENEKRLLAQKKVSDINNNNNKVDE